MKKTDIKIEVEIKKTAWYKLAMLLCKRFGLDLRPWLPMKTPFLKYRYGKDQNWRIVTLGQTKQK